MKKCPNTMSGKHGWVGGYTEPGYIGYSHTAVPISKKNAERYGSDTWEGKPYCVPDKYVERSCKYCGIIDDTFKENHD